METKENVLGTRKYLLISVAGREILTEQFDTLENAQKTMHEELIQWGHIPEECLKQKEYEDEFGNFGFGEYGGWANRGLNNADYDWSIVEL